MYFCNICVFYAAMGQGFEYDDMENNAVIVEICCFNNFLNMKWQNKTKSSANRLSNTHCSYIFLFLLSSV